MAQYKLQCFAPSGNSLQGGALPAVPGPNWEPVFVDFFRGQTPDPKRRATVNESTAADSPDQAGSPQACRMANCTGEGGRSGMKPCAGRSGGCARNRGAVPR